MNCLIELRRVWLPVMAMAVGSVNSVGTAVAIDESFFAAKVYPALQAAECNSCHNGNGVASETELAFPKRDASPSDVLAFGLELIELVDHESPDESLLLLKPTNREEHTGGERITTGSEEEQTLLSWVRYLASLNGEQLAAARKRIDRVKTEHRLGKLTTRRLTHQQYNNTVRDLLGDQSLPADQFPKEDFVNGFKNQIETQGVTPLQAEAYTKAAERLAASAFRGGDLQGLIPRQPDSPTDAAAAREFVRTFGRRAFRRPLTTSEIDLHSHLLLAESGRTGEFVEGARIVVECMLQSPSFLFRVEHGHNRPFAQYELASRLSYFVWNTMPDERLLRAAESGRLNSRAGVESIVRELLDDPHARESMEEFLSQWLRFDRVHSATPDRRKFGDFNSEIAAAMVEETRRLFNYLVWEDQDFMEFYSADYTFISSELANLYGMPAPAEDFARVSYPADSGRAGVLGHGSFLVSTSNPSETSPTSRGLFIRSHFLSQEVPAPPAGVNTNLPDITEDAPMTNRQRLTIHLNSEACSSCHRLIDPIGLGLEHYDPIGRFQETLSLQFRGERYSEEERPKPKTVELEIDTAGYIQGIPDSHFSTPKELGEILRTNETCQNCLVKQLFRYTFGRAETPEDQPVIDAAVGEFRKSDFRFRDLILAIATSRLFLQGGPETP